MSTLCVARKPKALIFSLSTLCHNNNSIYRAHYALDKGFFFYTLHFLAAAYYGANPIVMYRTTECVARDSSPATAP